MARKLIGVLAVLVILSFIFVEVLIVYNGYSQEDIEADYAIILGAGLNGSEISLTLKERLLKGIEYLEKYPDSKVIVSGGQGFRETITEAEAMERFLIYQGIAAGRIVKEDKASSTWENFIFSKKLLQETEGKAADRIVVITSDFHILRAKLLAKRAGLEPYGIASSIPVSARLNSHIREYLALIKSLLVDR